MQAVLKTVIEAFRVRIVLFLFFDLRKQLIAWLTEQNKSDAIHYLSTSWQLYQSTVFQSISHLEFKNSIVLTFPFLKTFHVSNHSDKSEKLSLLCMQGLCLVWNLQGVLWVYHVWCLLLEGSFSVASTEGHTSIQMATVSKLFCSKT